MLSRVAAVTLVLAGACADDTGGDGDGDDTDARTADARQDLVDAPSPDARPGTIDAPPSAIDAGIDAVPSSAPDTCAQAQDITAGAMQGSGITVTGDTLGYADNIRPSWTCTNFTPDGPDAIYSVTVDAGVTITAVATPTSNWDISIEIVQPCTMTPTCVAGMDFYLAGGAETVIATTTAPGTYYVVVDGYDPGAAGPYSLEVHLQ